MEPKARRRSGELRRLIGCRVTAREWDAVELLMEKTESDISGVLRAGLQCLAANHGVYWPTPPMEAAS